jgi:hypothetical protein
MAPINFSGKLPVAVVLQWKGETHPNSLTTFFDSFRHVIANDLLSAFTINVAGGSPTTITRKATKAKPQFDDALNTYTTDPASGPALDELLAPLIARSAPIACTIDLSITYFTFFDKLLQQMTRTDADLHNLANPNDSAAILNTFVHSAAGGNITITYKQTTEKLTGIPCRLVDASVTPRTGKAPGVKLVFELDFLPADDTKREMMRKLIAMDWSKLARFGQAITAGKTMSPKVEVWYNNRNVYVHNRTDIVRASKFLDTISARHETKSPKDLASDLRDDIDLHLVTANHWGQAREDMKTERHQRLLSDLFGTLHQKVYLASPVNCLRQIEALLDAPAINAKARFRPGVPLPGDLYAAMALQYGVGHCGEHAQVSFEALIRIIVLGPATAQVSVCVRGGLANIDHDFVVYQLQVLDVVRTVPTAKNNTRFKNATNPTPPYSVYNLSDAIAANAPRDGFIMDPYLDKTIMKPTAKELLDALNRPDRKKAKKHTDWLAFEDEFPNPKGPAPQPQLTVDDITTLPPADRLLIVPNV